MEQSTNSDKYTELKQVFVNALQPYTDKIDITDITIEELTKSVDGLSMTIAREIKEECGCDFDVRNYISVKFGTAGDLAPDLSDAVKTLTNIWCANGEGYFNFHGTLDKLDTVIEQETALQDTLKLITSEPTV